MNASWPQLSFAEAKATYETLHLWTQIAGKIRLSKMPWMAAYYCYIYPEPDGYKEASVQPAQAYYHPQLREFILPYAAVQQSDNPEGMVTRFLQSTYTAAADLAKWDRQALEQPNDSMSHKEKGF